MGHRMKQPAKVERKPIDLATATALAGTLQALTAPSRLMILDAIRIAPRTVTELTAAIGMEQSAISHQLRLLRALGLVRGERNGRSITYSLHDDHVAELLDQAIYHAEHLRLSAAGLGA